MENSNLSAMPILLAGPSAESRSKDYGWLTPPALKTPRGEKKILKASSKLQFSYIYLYAQILPNTCALFAYSRFFVAR